MPLLAAAEVWRRGGAAFSCSAGWRPAGGGDWRRWLEERWGAQGAQETQGAQEAAVEMQDRETCDAETEDNMGDYFENVVHQDLERTNNMFRNI